MSQWSGRVGEDAARQCLFSARAIGFGGLLVPVWAILFVVGHNSAVVIGLASALALLDLALLVVGVAVQHRMYRLLSDRFGNKVWFLNSPSLREGRFQAWCARHQVDPNSGRPLPDTDRERT